MYEITGPSKVLKLCNQLNLPTLGTISPVYGNFDIAWGLFPRSVQLCFVRCALLLRARACRYRMLIGVWYPVLCPIPVFLLLTWALFPVVSGEITLPAEARDSANIPQNATLFAFAYPLAGMGQLSEDQTKHINLGDLAHAFLSFGGYVYFDANGTATDAIC